MSLASLSLFTCVPMSREMLTFTCYQINSCSSPDAHSSLSNLRPTPVLLSRFCVSLLTFSSLRCLQIDALFTVKRRVTMTLHLRNGFLRGISNLSSNFSRTLVKPPSQFGHSSKTSPLSSLIGTAAATTASTAAKRPFSTTSQRHQGDTSDFSAVELYSSGKNAVRHLSEEVLEESLNEDDFFDLKGLVNMQELFDAGVHYGHKKGMGYECMTEYLLGHRFDNCIIDLNHTGKFLFPAGRC